MTISHGQRGREVLLRVANIALRDHASPKSLVLTAYRIKSNYRTLITTDADFQPAGSSG